MSHTFSHKFFECYRSLKSRFQFGDTGAFVTDWIVYTLKLAVKHFILGAVMYRADIILVKHNIFHN